MTCICCSRLMTAMRRFRPDQSRGANGRSWVVPTGSAVRVNVSSWVKAPVRRTRAATRLDDPTGLSTSVRFWPGAAVARVALKFRLQSEHLIADLRLSSAVVWSRHRRDIRRQGATGVRSLCTQFGANGRRRRIVAAGSCMNNRFCPATSRP